MNSSRSKERTLSVHHEDPDLLVIVLDSTVPEDMLDEMTKDVAYPRIVDATSILQDAEQKMFAQTNKGKNIGRFTRFKLRMAVKKAVFRATGFIREVGEDTRIVVIAPAYVDKEHLGVHLVMTCGRSIQTLGRN